MTEAERDEWESQGHAAPRSAILGRCRAAAERVQLRAWVFDRLAAGAAERREGAPTLRPPRLGAVARAIACDDMRA